MGHFAITYLKKNITGLLIGCDLRLLRRARTEGAEMEGVLAQRTVSPGMLAWQLGGQSQCDR